MSGQPTFSQECTDAFNSMNTQESPNDFFVCGFEGNTNSMVLVETGKGGMARVKDVLKEQFKDKTAVAMFRVTAVDDRENTVSYRTKLIHVIYTGPDTPVMKRAKITPFNSALKQPFTFNLSIQTSDEDGDLNEVALEKSLRASGGAHQPTRFDFTNNSAPGEGESRAARRVESRSPPQPSSPAAKHTPAADEWTPPPITQSQSSKSASASAPSVEEVMKHHNDTYDAKNIEELASGYASDAKVFHTDANTKRTTIYSGRSEIANFFSFYIDSQGGHEIIVNKSDIMGNIATLEWQNRAAGYHYGFDVFYITNGKIVLQTITTVSGSPEETVEPTQDQPEEAAESEPQIAQEHVTEEATGDAKDEAGEWEAVDQGEAAVAQEDAGDASNEVNEQEPTPDYAEEAPAEEAPAEEEQAAGEEAQAEAPQGEEEPDEFA